MEEIVKDIESNTKSIKSLLNEKTMVVGRIRTSLDLKALTNTEMSENQISQFVHFTDCYQKECVRNRFQ